VGQHRKDRFARGALNAPDGETTQANPSIMGMTGQRAAAVAAGFMMELKANREDKRHNALNEGFAITDQLKIGGLVLEVNGDGTVCSSCFGGVAHVSFLSHQAS
jgi:hypothetical protein